MFFLLSKALLFIISPFFWIVVATACGFVLRNKKWRIRSRWFAFSLFVVFTNTVTFSEFCKTWEHPPKKIEDVGYYDLGIVLGGMVEYNGDIDNISLRRSGDRIFQAITLYSTGHIKKILISGDSGQVGERGLHEAKQLKEVLLKWGIPEEDIITEEVSKNTFENAQETKKVLAKYPELKSKLLITSGTHMRRALGCFQKQGIKCACFSTDHYVNQSGNYHWDQYIIPNSDNFENWNILIKEFVGYVVYDVRGYI